mgnify:CR=1 FL=1
MKKRIVSTVLAAAMAASMISGCGASGQGATEAAKTEETKAEDAEGKEEGKAEEKAEASSDDPLKVVYLALTIPQQAVCRSWLTRWELRLKPSRWEETRPATKETTWMFLSRTGI